MSPRKLKERPTKPVVGIKASPGKLRQRRPKPVIMSPRKLRERPTKPVIGIKASPGKRRERRPKPAACEMTIFLVFTTPRPAHGHAHDAAVHANALCV
ncbi:hypothetical protein Tco_0653225, partial [Tanacetum coccineum]